MKLFDRTRNLMLNSGHMPMMAHDTGFGIESSDISSGDETLTDSTYENFKREKAYKAVPPPTEPSNHPIFYKSREHRVQGEQVTSFGTTSKGVNNSYFVNDTLVPSQRRSFIPSAVRPRDGVDKQSFMKYCWKVIIQGWLVEGLSISVYSPSSGLLHKDSHKPQRPKKIVKSIWVKKGSTIGSQAVLPQTVKKSAMINPKQTWRPKGNYLDSVNRDNGSYTLKQFEYGNPEEDLKDYAIIDSGCSGSMTGDKDKLSDFKEFKGGYVAFGNDSKGGRISGKGTIKTSCLDFEKVSYVEELKFNLLSVSQICDKKHNVLFTDKECLILSPKFKFVDEDLVILRAPRKNDVYSLDLKNIIPSGGITCLVAKATEDEAVLWHRRLGHVNFKNINKLVKGNLVRGLPSKTFKLDHSCLACRKGKQHRASCKKIEERTVREPLELLHMDLFGPVSVESVNRKKYCLVVTDDCSKFSWVFFLAYKDETYDMLHDLIVGLENKLRHKVKTIRCDHGTEFKNQLMNEFCAKKGIKREYSIARTPQQNGVAERKNRTLIEAARTMLADSLLPIQFWAEAVNTACYVLNRVLVTKPQMKTPYEILMGRSPNISFMRPFGCPLTILNTLDHLGKFDGKSEEGYLLGYSTNSKGFRVYNRVTRKVQDCLHVNFLENQENQKGKGPDWMFDLDLLTPSMNYIPVRKENYADSKEQGISCDDVEDLDDQQFIVHTAQPMHPEERTAAKEVPLSSEELLHDEPYEFNGCQECILYDRNITENVCQTASSFEDPASIPNNVYQIVEGTSWPAASPKSMLVDPDLIVLGFNKYGYRFSQSDQSDVPHIRSKLEGRQTLRTNHPFQHPSKHWSEEEPYTKPSSRAASSSKECLTAVQLQVLLIHNCTASSNKLTLVADSKVLLPPQGTAAIQRTADFQVKKLPNCKSEEKQKNWIGDNSKKLLDSIPVPYKLNLNSKLKGTDPKDKAKGTGWKSTIIWGDAEYKYERTRKDQEEWESKKERLMIRMQDHALEVEDETETALTLIHRFLLRTTEDGEQFLTIV
ncbi:putative ribonuclease H-like domain-containing protein [Tanacetum coccineum]